MILSILLALPGAVTHSTVKPSAWSYSEGRDQITDLPTARAAALSDDGRSRLVIKCDGAVEPVVSIQFFPDTFLGSGERTLTIRFDNLPAFSFDWEYVSQGAFNRSEDAVLALAGLLKGEHRVIVRAWNYRDQPVDAAFSVSGGKTDIERVLTTCKYPIALPERRK